MYLVGFYYKNTSSSWTHYYALEKKIKLPFCVSASLNCCNIHSNYS